MKANRSAIRDTLFLMGILGLLISGTSALGAIYTDTIGTDHYGGSEVDFANVVVTNDATNITFQINMNPVADIGTNHFANYEIGIQIPGNAANGQTAINGLGFGQGNPTYGNPYGNAVGISTGENFWIANFLDSPGNFSGGAQLFSYSSVTGWTQLGPNAPITEIYTGTPSSTFTFPLASLGLSPGNSFFFDVWSTFGSPQSAYDALDNLSTPPGTAPFSAGASYDAATAAGSTLASYTVTAVPEPSSVLLASLGGIGLLSLAFRRRVLA